MADQEARSATVRGFTSDIGGQPRAQLDGMYQTVRERCPNAPVPWYLMASFAYYHCDESLLSDAAFDALCRDLDARWEEVVHPHKHLVDRAALAAGTGYQLGLADYPLSTRGGARSLLRELRRPMPPAWMFAVEPEPMSPTTEAPLVVAAVCERAATPPPPPPRTVPTQLALF